MTKKDYGFIEKLLPVLLSTGIVFGIVLLSGQFMGLFRDREEMNQVARAYLLKMETIGHLPSDKMQELRFALEECGLEDINFAGTNTQPVSYGEPIYLNISGNFKRVFGVKIPFLIQKEQTLAIPIRMCLQSTAKH